jgi:hypothetical protein
VCYTFVKDGNEAMLTDEEEALISFGLEIRGARVSMDRQGAQKGARGICRLLSPSYESAFAVPQTRILSNRLPEKLAAL